ncbi:MAG: peroxiredoxin [Rikenellaceae bacterium]|nr:peroxiredoxin [Rikenellaceae bacterium]
MEKEQECHGMPTIGEHAPAFEAQTTNGKINFPEDFKGKWVILFSHPSDFTPVCTSEFVTFGHMQKEFENLNCQLIGLSIDGLASHIAWLRTIEEKIDFKGMKNVEVRFPLIDDVSMHVAKLYGMLQPSASETKAVRAVFFIDPKGIVRAVIYYPLSLGRNFDEIKRVLIGLQTIDEFGVSLPADWRPGDEVMVPAPQTCDAARERMADDSVKHDDWFFSLRELPKDKVEEKLYEKVK